ncbi:hypothetical protein D3C80_774820 [compost metagenome]
MLHRGQAVSDHQGGAPAHQGRQCLLDQVFALRIEGAGGFVEQQDRRIHQQGPGDRQALALATRQAQAGIAKVGLVTIGQLQDELMGMGTARGGLDLLDRGIGASVADVVFHRAEEQRRVLRYQRKVAAQVLGVEVAEVLAVEQDAPLLRVIKTQQQIKQRRLARPRRPDQGQGFAWFDRQAQAIDGGRRWP